jgi:hypothetical protein
MTCQELQSYYEGLECIDASLRAVPVKIAAHLADCADCRRFVDGRREVEVALRLLQEYVPETSSSLDAAVLSNYRKHVAEKPSSVGWIPAGTRSSFALVRWGAALAAVVLVTVILSPRDGKNITTIARPPATPRAVVSQTMRPGSNLLAVTKREVSHAAAHPGRKRHPAPSVATVDNPLPVRFRSLMYCDELSCSGPMEMIRVQLPSSAALLSTPARMNGVVFVDVLVGSDGIARGIRIVQ